MKIPGDSCDIDLVYRAVDDRTDPQHDPEHASLRQGGQHPRQSSAGDGRGGLHHLVHARIRAALQRLARQVEVLQGRAERDRPAGDNALLRVALPRRDKQERDGSVPGRAQGGADIPHYEDPQDPEAGAALDRPSEPRLHAEELVQGARAVDALPRHGRAHILEPGLLRREGGARDQIHKHSGDVLVGGHYHDHRWLRRHLPHYGVGQGHR